MRATSLRALRISLGVSNRSVADWKRKWNRFLTVSLSVRARCSSLMARNSAGFMLVLLALASDGRPARHEPAAKRHLVGDAGQGVAGRRLRQAADFIEDHARLDDRRPELRLALALAHARLGRDRCHRFVRKDADVQASFAAHRVRGGDAAGLDGLRAQPASLQGLQAEIAVADRVAARGVAAHLPALRFAELD